MKKDFLILSLGKIMQISLSLLSIKILTSILSKEEVGNYYLILSIVSYCSLVFINPIGMYVNRKFYVWKDENRILNSFFIYNVYILFISILSSVIIYLLTYSIGLAKNIDSTVLIFLVLISIFFNTWHQTIIPTLNMLYRRYSFTFFNIITILLAIFFSYIFISKNSSATNWIFGQLTSQVIIVVASFLYLIFVLPNQFNISKIKIKGISFKNILLFALPISFSTLFMWMQNQSYRIIIEKYINSNYLSMIAVGFSVSASISTAVESLIQQVYSPMYYKEINSEDFVKRSVAWTKMASISICLYISLLFFIASLAPFLVRILTDSKFYYSYYFVFFGAAIEFLRMISNIFSNIAHSEYQTKSLILPYLSGGIVSFFGVLIAVHYNNYDYSIPSILVISGIVTFIMMYVSTKKIMKKISLDWNLLKFSLIISIPFCSAIIFYRHSFNVLISLLILLLYGLYMLFIQLILFNKFRKKYGELSQ